MDMDGGLVWLLEVDGCSLVRICDRGTEERRGPVTPVPVCTPLCARKVPNLHEFVAQIRRFALIYSSLYTLLAPRLGFFSLWRWFLQKLMP